MGRITDVEVQSYTVWITANYESDDGEQYEIVFTRTCEENISYEQKEVVNVERLGLGLDTEHPIWTEIQENILSKDWDVIQKVAGSGAPEEDGDNTVFTISVATEDLAILAGLIRTIQSGTIRTPEEALEAGLFNQIRLQMPLTS